MPPLIRQKVNRTFPEMRTCLKQRGAGSPPSSPPRLAKTQGKETDGRQQAALRASHGRTEEPARIVGLCAREQTAGALGDAPRHRPPPPASKFVFRPCCRVSLMKVVLSTRSLVALVHITKSLYIIRHYCAPLALEKSLFYSSGDRGPSR